MHRTFAGRHDTARYHDLIDHFYPISLIAAATYIHARPKVAALRVFLLPPSQQHRAALGKLGYWPIELRCEIVYPAVVQPQLGIGVKLVVLVHASDTARITGAPDTERAQS